MSLIFFKKNNIDEFRVLCGSKYMILITILLTAFLFFCPCFLQAKENSKEFIKSLHNKKKAFNPSEEIQLITYYSGLDYLHKNKIVRIKKGVHFCYNIKF